MAIVFPGMLIMLACLLIMALSGAATATVALNTVSGIASEVFPALNQINAPKGVVTPEYSGGPQTFLILGTDDGTYYAPEQALTRDNAQVIINLAATRGPELVNLIIDVSEVGRAAKQNPTLFALAICTETISS